MNGRNESWEEVEKFLKNEADIIASELLELQKDVCQFYQLLDPLQKMDFKSCMEMHTDKDFDKGFVDCGISDDKSPYFGFGLMPSMSTQLLSAKADRLEKR